MKNIIILLSTILLLGCKDDSSKETVNLFEYKDNLRSSPSYDDALNTSDSIYKSATKHLISDSLFNIDRYIQTIGSYKESIKKYLTEEHADSLKLGMLSGLVTRLDVISKQDALALLTHVDSSKVKSELFEKVKDRIYGLSKYGLGDYIDVREVYSYEDDEPIQFNLESDYNIIFFWSTWCGPCKQFYPQVNQVKSTFDENEASVIGFSMDKSKRKFLSHQTENNFKFKTYADLRKWDSKNAAQFGVKFLPTVFLVDRTGKVLLMNPIADLNRIKLNKIVKNLLDQQTKDNESKT